MTHLLIFLTAASGYIAGYIAVSCVVSPLIGWWIRHNSQPDDEVLS